MGPYSGRARHASRRRRRRRHRHRPLIVVIVLVVGVVERAEAGLQNVVLCVRCGLGLYLTREKGNRERKAYNFKNAPRRNLRQRRVEHHRFREQAVHQLVDVRDGVRPVHVAHPDLPVVAQDRLEHFVHRKRLTHEPQVERAQHPHVLEVVLRDEVLHRLQVRLHLQHLQQEAQELRRLAVAAVRAAHSLKLRRLLQHVVLAQAEAVLLPVLVVVDALPHNLLNEVLRIHAVDGLRTDGGDVRHCWAAAGRSRSARLPAPGLC